MAHLRPSNHHSQRGAAVLMALFVATLATLIVAGLFWTQFVVLRTIENQQLVTQSRLLLRGAVDWSRAILREDQRTSSVDSLSEPWSVGLEETKLDQLGETSTLASRAALAGSIEDAQGRFNLRNLLLADLSIDEQEVAALRKLCNIKQVPEAVADLIAARMYDAWAAPSQEQGTAANPSEDSFSRPIPLVMPFDLLGVDGIDPRHALELAPYVVVLDQVTPVNLNTASAEVIAAIFPSMSLGDARTLVRERERTYFVNIGDTRIARHRPDGEPSDTKIATSSRYFIVRGQVRLERAQTRMEALIRRGDSWQNPPRVIWQREL